MKSKRWNWKPSTFSTMNMYHFYNTKEASVGEEIRDAVVSKKTITVPKQTRSSVACTTFSLEYVHLEMLQGWLQALQRLASQSDM